MADIKQGHVKAIAGVYGSCNETPGCAYIERPQKTIHEQPGQNEMEGHGVSISLVRGDQPKEESQRVENRGLKMGPKRNPPKYVRVPERNGVMKMNLVVKKLLDGEIKLREIVSGQALSSQNDFPKEEKNEANQKTNDYHIPSVDVKRP